ncbi:hypothetical protein PHYBLDRAFT_60930 [Phycomyces blakesleeanus NRRL 1555(-)]|uniref:Homeodomain-like DNA binding domain-containing transcription factor n=1 Tax=Phycomyces blakesleeanus (strain ATCC 8743b / DSM 1359 / FGSC 10004 / NBRC 33097 / NRRL 1555) TaxID=763407 RepID=A0A167PFD1_PHYB8|nr:hypothetical protein PHYBLDRAFT_60930 [Phycomyces blakesleeanus NRRL 1555(-)]OAD77804.1 hypothetical protein PHYBLDRAFT_60930 [Phycomyces blakesleeanus NRRL 1555(-)]|eukprot:XP_018295844.1 hypothetical protein PHYBLDRAFT_60930 [Phycomyces blakesleeanus NRRL 1555(-)]
MENKSTSNKKIERRSSEYSSNYNTELTKLVLVTNDFTAELISSNTNINTAAQFLEFDRMEINRDYQARQEINEKCLVELSEFAASTLNTSRYDIASVYKVIHPTKSPIVSHQLLVQFFLAKIRLTVRLPNHCKEIYDTIQSVNHVESWCPTSLLTLDRLQQKIILLLEVATMWRPRSNLGNLQFQDVHSMVDEKNHLRLRGVPLIARQPKEVCAKISKLGIFADSQACLKSKDMRRHLPEDHRPFLESILGEQSSGRSTYPTTIENWIKKMMIFGLHSLRSASSTKAIIEEASVQEVKLHANWSLNSSTLERYYFRLVYQCACERDIAEKFLGKVTKNKSTSKVGVEPTVLALGTIHNGNIGETKTEDVVPTCPNSNWKKFLNSFF